MPNALLLVKAVLETHSIVQTMANNSAFPGAFIGELGIPFKRVQHCCIVDLLHLSFQKGYLKADAQLRKVHSLQAGVLADVDPQAILEGGCMARQLYPSGLIFVILHVLHSVRNALCNCTVSVNDVAGQ